MSTQHGKPSIPRVVPLAVFLVGAGWAAVTCADAPQEYFSIRVVDQQTGRGVPLVELRTVDHVRYFTDSAGIVAFHEPGLMNAKVYFHVGSHGYEYPADGFGYRGKALDVKPGGTATLEVKRLNVAERLYRVTGAGIYRDSLLVGREPPLRQPLLNGRVFGSDSVVNAVYRGRVYWFWGDTNRPSYPLGNFHVPGATSALPADGGLDPEQGVDLEYFVDDSGFAKPTCQMPGKGPTWINGLVALRDNEGQERLYAKYVKIEPPLKVYERGLVRFNDAARIFDKVTVFTPDAELYPAGHPVLHGDGEERFIYFPQPFPTVRVAADADALSDSSRYEAYTCFAEGSTAERPKLDRDADGKLVFRWRRGGLPFTLERQSVLEKKGLLSDGEGFYRLRDVESGEPVRIHSGSVNWNAFRQRWILIGVQLFGSSLLGEIWYSEAPRLEGPWRRARKIVSHEQYSFYNPKHHAMFDQQDGRVIFFEGTYTTTFSGNPDRTPRYDYNQVMYKLDLADPRLKPVQQAAGSETDDDREREF